MKGYVLAPSLDVPLLTLREMRVASCEQFLADSFCSQRDFRYTAKGHRTAAASILWTVC